MKTVGSANEYEERNMPQGVEAEKPPMEQNPDEKRRAALVDCFTESTWVALGFALLCLTVDAIAMFVMPHHPTSGGTHGMTVFAVVLWTLEIVLAILALWLIRFAFSQPARFVSNL